MHRPRRRRPADPRRALTGLARAVLVTALAAGAASCSKGHDVVPPNAGGPSTTVTSDAPVPPSVKTMTTVRRVVGRKKSDDLSTSRRNQLKSAVAATVDEWIDAAYLGAYPRSRPDFRRSFTAFTGGAARRAQHDLGLMSNADLGDAVTSVTARKRRLRLDVLVVKGVPTGVTAQVSIGLDVVGATEHHDRITGQLFLTHEPARHGEPGRWAIFGYDVKRGEV